MKQINSSADFEAMLQAEWAVVFVLFESSAWAEEFERNWETKIQREGARRGSQIEWYVLKPDRHPFTWKWTNAQIETRGGNLNSFGCLLQLKKGEPVGGMSSDAIFSEELLRSMERMSHHAVAPSFSRELIDAGLLKMLCCPETHQSLELADARAMEQLNQQIAAGHLQNRAGIVLRDKLDGGLLRADGRWLYPIRQNIPVLLVDEAIALAP